MKNKVSLVSGVIFFVIGVILFTNPDAFIKTISYVIGGILILVGLYKVFNYYIQNKRLKVVNHNEMAFGITAIILGIVFIFLASAIELLIRFILGGYLILAGINKIIQTFYTTDRTSKFYALIVVGVLFVGVGIYTICVSNLPLSIIGLFMMIYGLIDFVSYFIYKNESEIDNTQKTSNEEEKKIINVKDEVVEEVEFIEKEESSSKASKTSKKGTKKSTKKTNKG